MILPWGDHGHENSPNNVHENSPKKRTSYGQVSTIIFPFCPGKFNFYVHKKSATRINHSQKLYPSPPFCLNVFKRRAGHKGWIFKIQYDRRGLEAEQYFQYPIDSKANNCEMLGCNNVLTTSHVCSCKRRRRVAGQRTLIKVQRTMR